LEPLSISQEEIAVVKSQRYEEAARLRDDEKENGSSIRKCKEEAWEDSIKLNKKTVDEPEVAEVVAMMTGVPVQRVAQQELEKLGSDGGSIAFKRDRSRRGS